MMVFHNKLVGYWRGEQSAMRSTEAPAESGASLFYTERMPYDPHTSGLLTGGGTRRFKPRKYVVKGGRLKHFPDVHLSDPSRLKRAVPDFDPALEFEYTQRELLLLAEKILLEDEKTPYENPAWLNAATMKERLRHEIYCASGIPDPSIAQGLYWRTHPEGRKWKSAQERAGTTKGFYR